MKRVEKQLTVLAAKLMARKYGQGVIEYAGAMIVAALIVAAVLVIGQAGMGNVYNTIFKGVETYFTGQSANL